MIGGCQILIEFVHMIVVDFPGNDLFIFVVPNIREPLLELCFDFAKSFLKNGVPTWKKFFIG
jgi:hypothetical protein